MKKITLLLTMLFIAGFSWLGSAQTICSQNFTASGQDDDPTIVTVVAADITCNAGKTINSITFKNAADNLTNSWCSDWYDFTLTWDGPNAGTVTGCAADLNNSIVTGFSTLTVTSADLDVWSDSVTITFDLEVNYVDYCGGDHFYDTGGAAANYSTGENITTTIFPDTPGDLVTVAFNSYNTESGYDFLKIYDGPDNTQTLLGDFSGTSIPGPFTSTHTSGSLTFVFTSDGSVQDAGWDATITCAAPPPLSNPSTCGLGLAITGNACPTQDVFPISVTTAGGSNLGTDVILSKVKVIINHTWDDDLEFSLVSPNGVTVLLSSDNGGSGDNYGDMTVAACGAPTEFNMTGVDGLITAGTAPFVGSFIPEGNFSDFNDGSSPIGLWKLEICDDAGGDNGTLEYIELEFSTPADLCTNAIPLTLGVVFDDNDIASTNVNKTASGETPSPNCALFGSGEDTWFSIVVPDSGNVTIEVAGNGGLTDTGLAVYEGACGSLTQISCNDDIDGVNNRFSHGIFTGRTPGETLYARVWDYANNDTGTFLISAYTKCSGATLTWNTTTAEFTGNATPDEHTPIIFPAGTSNGTGSNLGNITACSCELNGNATIEIDTGDFFKIINDVTLNDTSEMYIYDKASFVQVDDDAAVTVAAAANIYIETSTRSLIDTGRYTYVSSPVQSETLAAFDWAIQNRIWQFDESIQDWILAAPADTMIPGKGYIVRPDPSQTFPYTGNTLIVGTINNGVITRPLTYDPALGDNDNTLVGNPYPSPIDTQMLLANNPRANAFYFWTHENAANSDGNFTSNDDYAVWNSSGPVSGPTVESAPAYIAPSQGFFVVSNAGTDPLEITFNNALRTTNNNNGLLRPNNNLDKIWINLTNNANVNNQILIAFNPICTDGFDAQYDASKFNSGSSVSFASIGTDVNTDNLVIQTRGLLDDTDTVIPLRIDVTDSNITNFTISIDHFENLTNENVYLRDNELNVLHNLKLSDYNFSLNTTGTINTRFELVFSRTALSIKDDVVSSNDLIISNLDETHIKVSMNDGSTITNFKAYDVLGKSIIDIQPNQHSFDISTRINQGTVIFIKATLENGQVLSKKFIKL